MRYLFESTVEKEEKGYMIRIPFNIWEVCRQRDVISAEVILDDKTFACELRPKEKGNYVLYIEDGASVDVEPGVPREIILHVSGSLTRMDQDSPYSLDAPIRKIDGIKVIIQPKDGLCGQACVAMLAGVTIADVSKVMDCREWQATMGMVISALNYYGIAHSDTIVYTEGRSARLPKCCVMMEKMGRFCHYLVHYDGKFYDSNLGVLEEYDMSKLLGYLEVMC